MTNDTDDLVPFQVPRSHYAAMVAALAVEMAKTAGDVQSAADDVIGRPATEGNHPFEFANAQRSSHAQKKPMRAWTANDLKALRQAVTAKPVARAMLDLTFKQADKPVSFSEVCAVAGVSHAQGRAGLAGLTVLVRNRFDRDNWPVTWQWAAGGEAQAYYIMSTDVASLWSEN
jgi:hypothetical protein